jgi:hypothetical protein
LSLQGTYVKEWRNNTLTKSVIRGTAAISELSIILCFTSPKPVQVVQRSGEMLRSRKGIASIRRPGALLSSDSRA